MINLIPCSHNEVVLVEILQAFGTFCTEQTVKECKGFLKVNILIKRTAWTNRVIFWYSCFLTLRHMSFKTNLLPERYLPVFRLDHILISSQLVFMRASLQTTKIGCILCLLPEYTANFPASESHNKLEAESYKCTCEQEILKAKLWVFGVNFAVISFGLI